MIEYFGWILWLSSIAFEHTADLQKKKFVRDCIKNKIKNAVCDVGLWRYRYIFDIYAIFQGVGRRTHLARPDLGAHAHVSHYAKVQKYNRAK